MLHIQQIDPPQDWQQTSEERLFLHPAMTLWPTPEPQGSDTTQGRGKPPQAFTPNETRTKMTIQIEQQTEQTEAEKDAAKADVLKQLSDIRDAVAKADAAKPLRDELIMKADALGVGPTKIAEAAGVTRRMIYVNRAKGEAGASSTED